MCWSQSGGSLPRAVKGRGRALYSPECPMGGVVDGQTVDGLAFEVSTRN